MKHFFLRLSGLILALFIGMGVGQGQILTEDFTNSNATSSYATSSFVGNNSITWNYIASRDENGDANNSGINGNALMLRRSSDNSKVYSNSIPGGIGNFSVKLYKGFTGGGNRQVELFINGISKGTSTPFDDYDEHIFEVNTINISGDVVIEIRNITSKQVIVDDITWTGYSATANNPPSITNITQDPSADVTPNNTVSVSADVTDSDGTISSVSLNWGTSSGNLGTTIAMSNGGSGDSFTTNTDIPAQVNGTTVYYAITASDNDGDETTSAEQSYQVAIINPSNFAATTESTTSISLGWTLNPSSDNVMIARSSSDSFGTPSDGTGYSASDALGDATVIYVGNSTSFPDNSLAAATTYYYKAWSVTGSNGYSEGTTSVSATTFSPEPSNHPTGLSATTNTSSSITLSWTDATAGSGEQLPQAYLVKAAAGSAPSAPADGTAEADADLVKNVVHGSQTVTFTNLTPETEYQFKIWPYTNSGSGINYKTDGSVPTVTATTGATADDPTVIDLDNDANWTQGADGFTSYSNHSYAEGEFSMVGASIIRDGTSDQDGFPSALGTYSIRLQNNSSASVVFTIASGGVNSWSIKVRRWDGSPMPDYSVEFSTDNGINYTSAPNIDGTLLTNSDWKLYSHTIESSNENIKIRISNTGSTERIMIDDFSFTGFTGGSGPDPEPTNHVTGFTANVVTFSQIDLSWTDATAGSQTPAGYLVKANAGSSPSAPSDGTMPDAGALVQYVNPGVESASFTDLNESTSYSFSIWPYTNTGSDIDFKTDGSVPTATATTPAAPPQPIVWINEFHYDNAGNDSNEFIEVVLKNAGDYNLADISIIRYNGGDNESYGTTTLDEFVLGSAIGDFSIYSITYSSNGIQNGDPDGFAIAYDGTLISGQFISYGGTFTGVGGVADGVTSTDIGITQSSVNTPANSSLQLTGVGLVYDDFYWIATDGSNTKGAINSDQLFASVPASTSYTGNSQANGNSWLAASNWNNGIPGKNSEAILPPGLSNYPSLSNPRRVKKITLESGATIVGADKLSVAETAKVKREISGYDGQGSGAGWHLIATPLSAVDVATSDFVSGTYDLYRYDESTNSWINQKVAGNSAQFDDFVPGIGYLYATQTTATRNFESTGFNTADVSFTNLSLTNGAGGGWHLLGNPFPANLNFGTGWTLTNVNGTGQVLKTDGTGYKTISNGDVIASNQGFWIQVSDATNSITIPASAATHSSAPFSAKSGIADLKCYLHLDANRKVETRIQIRPDATDGFDWAFDANYLPPMSADMPRMYTTIAGKEAALNAFHLDSAYSLPLAVDVTEECTYPFEINGLESLPEATKVYLIDHLTQETHLLNESPNLVLSYSPNDGQERFELQFVLGSLSMEIATNESNFSAYSSGKLLVVNNPFQENNPIRMEIYSLTGQLLHLDESYFTGEKQVPLSLSTGFYLLKMSDGQHSLNQSFFIR